MNRTGGTWRRAESPVYFVATQPSNVRWTTAYPHVLVAVNDVMEKAGEDLLVTYLETGHTVFLDSGIFWLTNRHMRAHHMTMDEALSLHPKQVDGFPALFDRYVTLVQRYGDQCWGYVELDQGGVARKRETRARLEELGLAPIPVYHPLNDGRDYLEELMTTYDRICFGNIVQADRATRQRLLHLMYEAKCRHPEVWIHVLGLTPSEVSLAFPADSSDSSSWTTAQRWHKADREKSMLKSISGHPRNQAYKMRGWGEPGDPNTARRRAIESSLVAYSSLQATWRAVLQERRDLGFDPYDRGLLA